VRKAGHIITTMNCQAHVVSVKRLTFCLAWNHGIPQLRITLLW